MKAKATWGMAILAATFTAACEDSSAPPAAAIQSSNLGQSRTVRVAPLPSDARIIFWSTRNVSNSGPLGPSHLYVMNADGGNVTQITFEAHFYEHAAVSFDHKYILTDRYLKDGAGPTGMWLFDLEAKTETRLLPDFYAAGGGGVDWSPDGYMYFAGMRREGAEQNIWRMKPDGSGLENLTKLTQNPRAVPPDPGYAGDVSVSEDGKKVAYLRGFAAKVGNSYRLKPQIWTMNADGSNQRMANDGGPAAGSYGRDDIGGYDPEISPDGNRVIFSITNTTHRNFAATVNTAHDIWVCNLDGSQLRRVTEPGPVCIIPDWSGDQILFTEYNEKDNYIGLTLVNADGTGKKQLEKGLGLGMFKGGRHGKFIPPRKP